MQMCRIREVKGYYTGHIERCYVDQMYRWDGERVKKYLLAVGAAVIWELMNDSIIPYFLIPFLPPWQKEREM